MILIDASSIDPARRPWHAQGAARLDVLVCDLRTLTRDWDAPAHVVIAGARRTRRRIGALNVWQSGPAGTADLIGVLASSSVRPVLVVTRDPCAVRRAHLAGALVVSPHTLRAALDRVCSRRAAGVIHPSPLARSERALLGLERARRWFAAAQQTNAA